MATQGFRPARPSPFRAAYQPHLTVLSIFFSRDLGTADDPLLLGLAFYHLRECPQVEGKPKDMTPRHKGHVS